MNRFFIFFTFFVISTLGFHTTALAGNCTVCGEEAGEGALKCSQKSSNTKHETCCECVKHLANSIEITSEKQAREIQNHGLQCYGNGGKCSEKISMAEIEKISGWPQEFKNFTTKLNSATSSCNPAQPSAISSSSSVEDLKAKRVQEFQNQIQEAFNLKCPKCHRILAPIEGCNAAICHPDDQGCGARFCYLCLKKEGSAQANHAHAHAHSGDYWEHRDFHTGVDPKGQRYQEYEKYQNGQEGKPYTHTHRYHWQIVREHLEAQFQQEQDPEVKERAVRSLEGFLKKNKMWPFPVGKELDAWVNEVSQDPSLDERNRVALLQNELVYQEEKKSKDGIKKKISRFFFPARSKTLDRVKTLKGALLSLNAPILSSLDINGRPNHPGQQPNPAEQNHNSITPVIEGHADPRVNQLYVQLRNEAAVPAQNRPDPHVTRFFDLGGEDGGIYVISDPTGQVAPFVLSGNAPRKMKHKEAAGWDDKNGVHHLGYCEKIGARLMTEEELYALDRAMSPGGRYNPNAIAGMANTWVWSSSVHPSYLDEAFVFNGSNGLVVNFYRGYDRSVRCVRAAVAW